MNDVNEMLIFARVAKEGSFTKAALSLDLQKSNVSRKVAQLEERLNMKLLDRTTRAVSLTDAGEIYYEHCRRVIEEIEAANLAVAQMQSMPTGTLRICAPVALGVSMLSELVTDFMRAYEQIKVELILKDTTLDMLDAGFDLAFGGGPAPGANYVSRKLGDAQWVLCCSPSYAERKGEPKTLEELTEHPAILFSSLIKANIWSFSKPSGRQTITVHSCLSVNDLTAVRRATLAGLGIAKLPVLLAADDVKAGKLQTLLPEWQLKPNPLYMVYPSSRHLSAKLRAFLDFVFERAKPAHPWFLRMDQALAILD